MFHARFANKLWHPPKSVNAGKIQKISEVRLKLVGVYMMNLDPGFSYVWFKNTFLDVPVERP